MIRSAAGLSDKEEGTEPMEKREKADRTFRRKLREELAAWQTDGLVSAEQAQAIEGRYSLSGLAAEGTGLLIATIYTIGSVLIAGGVISFVAAHWTAIPKTVKVLLIFAVMLSAHAGGYVLWRVKATKPRLGHALVMLGTLIFGANIGLMAQIFHIKSAFYNGFFAWAIGAAVISYCLMSVPNAVIAVVASFVWFCGWIGDHPDTLSWYPVALLATGLPFAYLKRSAVAFFLVLVSFAVSAPIAIGVAVEAPVMVFLTGIGASLLLVACGVFHRAVKPRPEVSNQALVLGGVSLAVWSNALSFADMAEEVADWMWAGDDAVAAFALVFILAVLCVGVLLSWRSRKEALQNARLRPYVISIWIGVGLTHAACIVPWGGILAVLFSNMALLALGVGLVWSGLVGLNRRVFWLGVALIALTILSRFLEYDTGLLLKSVAFLASGAGVIYGGIRFENVLRKKGTVHE